MKHLLIILYFLPVLAYGQRINYTQDLDTAKAAQHVLWSINSTSYGPEWHSLPLIELIVDSLGIDTTSGSSGHVDQTLSGNLDTLFLSHTVDPTDTVIVSGFLFISDTTAMLSPYLESGDLNDDSPTNELQSLTGNIDTLFLSGGTPDTVIISGFVSPSDTAAMLSNYTLFSEVIQPSDTSSMLSTYLEYSDTSTMLSNYTLFSEVIQPSDTAAMLSSYLESSDLNDDSPTNELQTLTGNIDTLFLSGGTPDTVIISGFISPSDTASMLSNYTLFSEVIQPSDTASMLSHYLLYSDTASMLSNYLLSSEDNTIDVTESESGGTQNIDTLDFGLGMDVQLKSYGAQVNFDFSEFNVESTPEGDEYFVLADGAVEEILFWSDAEAAFIQELSGNLDTLFLSDPSGTIDTVVVDGFLLASDTTAMLAPYLLASDTTSMLSAYMEYGDTSSMLTHYLLGSEDSDTQLSQEEVQDFVGSMVSGNTETLISVTYDDAANEFDFVVENDLSLYDNSTSGFLTSEVDGSVSNEGSLTVGAGTSTTSLIQSNTSGSTDVTFEAGTNVTLSESGNTITIAATGGGSSEWAESGTIIYPTDDEAVVIGTTSQNGSNYLTVEGGGIYSGGGYFTQETPAITGREYLFRGSVSDDSQAGFGIFNATSVSTRMIPAFYGVGNSNDDQALFFRGLIRSTDDSGSDPIVQFDASTITNTSDPINETYNPVSTRPLFRFSEDGSEMLQVTADQEWIWRGDNIDTEIDANGHVGIGTSPNTSHELLVYETSFPTIQIANSTTGSTSTDGGKIELASDDLYIENSESAGNIYFQTNSTTRAGFLSNGDFYIDDPGSGTDVFEVDADGNRISVQGIPIIVGSGSPEGSVTAPVGSLYLRTDGGSSTTLYVKESGTGNTGWAAK